MYLLPSLINRTVPLSFSPGSPSPEPSSCLLPIIGDHYPEFVFFKSEAKILLGPFLGEERPGSKAMSEGKRKEGKVEKLFLKLF